MMRGVWWEEEQTGFYTGFDVRGETVTRVFKDVRKGHLLHCISTFVTTVKIHGGLRPATIPGKLF